MATVHPTSAPTSAGCCAFARAASSGRSPPPRPGRSRARRPPSRMRGSRPGGARAWRILRSGYQALKRLSDAVYYSSPEIYPLIGYPGPPSVPQPPEVARRVDRPDRLDQLDRPVAPAASSPAPSSPTRRRSRSTTSSSAAALAGARPPQSWPPPAPRVVVLEEGGHYTRRDFNMQESWAYPALYQEHGNRATDDLSILILQGRSVGGGTTVNWTSSFRTPERTLAPLGGPSRRARARRGHAGAALRRGRDAA